MPNDATPSPAAPPVNERLVSLDALRGFDMLWIIGGDKVVHAAALLTGWSWLGVMSAELHHPEWHGFTFYDLIFPLFLFIAGVAMPLSFDKRLARGDHRTALHRHVVQRGLLLVLLGMIFNGLLDFDWANMRYPSVLGRIGLAYLFAGLIVLNTRWRGQALWIIGLLLGYWAALKWIPVPGFGAGDLAPGHTLTDFIDRSLIPGQLYKHDRDPEGLFATIPAIATALGGALTGRLLTLPNVGGWRKCAVMAAAGLVCLVIARLWDLGFPINKNLWSSSFAVYCAGWSLLLLAAFYLVIDVWRYRAWTLPFVVIGSNAILIYMAQRFVDFQYTAERLFGGAIQYTGAYQPLLAPLAVLTVEWSLLYVLYRKRIFFRV